MDPGRMTPRSKHYGVKYHWFRSKLKPNDIEVSYIKSKDQRADFLNQEFTSLAIRRKSIAYLWLVNYYPSLERECNDIRILISCDNDKQSFV
jgi:hypothetical protein